MDCLGRAELARYHLFSLCFFISHVQEQIEFPSMSFRVQSSVFLAFFNKAGCVFKGPNSIIWVFEEIPHMRPAHHASAW